jgi:hypothetical protein
LHGQQSLRTINATIAPATNAATARQVALQQVWPLNKLRTPLRHCIFFSPSSLFSFRFS